MTKLGIAQDTDAGEEYYREKIESSQEEKLLHGFLTCVLFSWRILGLSHFPRRGRGEQIVDSLLSSGKGTLSSIGALQLPSRRKSAKWERKSADFVINCWQSESDQHPHSIWLGTPRRKLVYREPSIGKGEYRAASYLCALELPE